MSGSISIHHKRDEEQKFQTLINRYHIRSRKEIKRQLEITVPNGFLCISPLIEQRLKYYFDNYRSKNSLIEVKYTISTRIITGMLQTYSQAKMRTFSLLFHDIRTQQP